MRKIIQIAVLPTGRNSKVDTYSSLFALCNDGTVWIKIFKRDNEIDWHLIDISTVEPSQKNISTDSGIKLEDVTP